MILVPPYCREVNVDRTPTHASLAPYTACALHHSFTQDHAHPRRPNHYHTPQHLHQTDKHSDHLPIIMQLFPPTTKTQKKKTYTNYKKARWELFAEHTETHLVNFNIENFTSIDAAYTHFTKIITQASMEIIPWGNNKNCNPNFTIEIKTLIKQITQLEASHTSRHKT